MRYGKWFIGLITAAFVLVAVIFGKSEYSWDGTVEVRALAVFQDQTEEIRSWEKDRDDIYLFLPGNVRLEDIRLYAQAPGVEILLEGEPLEQGRTAAGFAVDVEYDICYLYRGKEHHYDLTFRQSSDLPALYVDTASGNMIHIHKKKGNEETGMLRLYNEAGRLEYSGELEEIKGRGNSTWEYEKKPYNLTLKEAGDLLGMGAATRWILLANATDASNLRNKLAYDLAKDAGLAYTPECRWVDLYLNGEYAGLYLLSERNEIHEERIAIGRENTFLVAKDWRWRFEEAGNPFVLTKDNTALRIYQSDFSREALLDIVQTAENAILGKDGIDPVTGKHWRELIDVDSWAKKYLVEEILGNVDASTLSQFYYYDGSGKIFAGPVWDMDLILKKPDEPWLKSNEIFYGVTPHAFGSSWIPSLFAQKEFREEVMRIYEEEFLPLLEKLRDGGVQAYAEQITKAAQMNNHRWQVGDAGNQAEQLREVLADRIQFLNRIWVQKEPYVIVTVSEYNGRKTSFAHTPGEVLPSLPEYKSDENTIFYGWYHHNIGTPFDPSQPVWEDIHIEIWSDIR